MPDSLSCLEKGGIIYSSTMKTKQEQLEKAKGIYSWMLKEFLKQIEFMQTKIHKQEAKIQRLETEVQNAGNNR
jgi:polyhydroxyalkanoate synthesis regulator phasin